MILRPDLSPPPVPKEKLLLPGETPRPPASWNGNGCWGTELCWPLNWKTGNPTEVVGVSNARGAGETPGWPNTETASCLGLSSAILSSTFIWSLAGDPELEGSKGIVLLAELNGKTVGKDELDEKGELLEAVDGVNVNPVAEGAIELKLVLKMDGADGVEIELNKFVLIFGAEEELVPELEEAVAGEEEKLKLELRNPDAADADPNGAENWLAEICGNCRTPLPDWAGWVIKAKAVWELLLAKEVEPVDCAGAL